MGSRLMIFLFMESIDLIFGDSLNCQKTVTSWVFLDMSINIP